MVALAQNHQGSTRIDTNGKERKRLKEGELPPELDFFKYATAGPSKRKPSGPGGEDHAKTKRHRKDGSDANAEDEVDGDNSITTNPSDNSGMPRQRVTIKGNSAPRRADTFKELHDRYRIHSQLMDNLKRYGYEDPTGIQSAGCPILLEVSSLIVLYKTSSTSWLQSRDLAAVSPTGTGKTLSYLLPVFVLLKSPMSNSTANTGKGIRTVILAPTRELAHQIYNECLKLAQGRKWRIILFSKATAATLADKSVQDKVGMSFLSSLV